MVASSEAFRQAVIIPAAKPKTAGRADRAAAGPRGLPARPAGPARRRSVRQRSGHRVGGRPGQARRLHRRTSGAREGHPAAPGSPRHSSPARPRTPGPLPAIPTPQRGRPRGTPRRGPAPGRGPPPPHRARPSGTGRTRCGGASPSTGSRQGPRRPPGPLGPRPGDRLAHRRRPHRPSANRPPTTRPSRCSATCAHPTNVRSAPPTSTADPANCAPPTEESPRSCADSTPWASPTPDRPAGRAEPRRLHTGCAPKPPTGSRLRHGVGDGQRRARAARPGTARPQRGDAGRRYHMARPGVRPVNAT